MPTEQLILSQLPAVYAVARSFHKRLPASIELGDLVGDGSVGLLKAAARYREGHGASFPTFVRHSIRGEIVDGLRRRDCVSRKERIRRKQIASVTEKLQVEFQRIPEQSEIESRLGAAVEPEPKEIALSLCTAFEPVDPHTPESLFARTERANSIRARLQKLPQRLQAVVRLRYWEDRPFKEIGKMLGVNESRAHQLNTEALGLLKGELQ